VRVLTSLGEENRNIQTAKFENLNGNRQACEIEPRFDGVITRQCYSETELDTSV
jgi:hypothetical protein